VIGGDPQDKRYSGEPTYLTIGNNNVFRECVTIHRATGEGKTTRVGNDNFIMAYTHFGHNVTINNNITIANCVQLAGHVTVEDLVTLGGGALVHQYCRIGKGAMVGGGTHVNRDAPPHICSPPVPQEARDINAVGLRRLGIDSTARLSLHKACKILFRTQLGLSNAMETVKRECAMNEHVEYLLNFLERLSKGKNGRGDQP